MALNLLSLKRIHKKTVPHKRRSQTLFPRIPVRIPVAVLAGALYLVQPGFGQSDKASHSGATITVAVDGLTCNSQGQGSFLASGFGLAVTTTSGSGGAGAGKTTVTDLAILKPTDSCSLALFVLAANAQVIKSVVLTQDNKGNGPSFTITLENVLLVRSSLSGSELFDGMEESLELSYSAITITDDSGHSTGRIVREPGSVPFSPATKAAQSSEI